MTTARLPEELEKTISEGFEHLGEGRAERALALAERVSQDAEDVPVVHELRALALTLLGRIEEADRAFARAAELDPEEYFVPFRLDGDAFDAAVEEVLAGLPDGFRRYLANVEIGVEDVPSVELIEEDVEFDLLGFYLGSTAESDDWGFPDRVVLFQRNLENISPDRDTLLAEIRDTLLHEVGHHFGMDEDTLREIEAND